MQIIIIILTDEGGIFVPLSNMGSSPITSIPQLAFGIDTSPVGSILQFQLRLDVL